MVSKEGLVDPSFRMLYSSSAASSLSFRPVRIWGSSWRKASSEMATARRMSCISSGVFTARRPTRFTFFQAAWGRTAARAHCSV